jgi:hypothetical protein
MEQRKVCFARPIVRSVAKDLRNDVGSAKDLSTPQENLSAFCKVLGIGITGFDTRARFDNDLESCLGEIGDHRGDERNAPLPWIAFARNANNHEAPPILWTRRCRETTSTTPFQIPDCAAAYAELRLLSGSFDIADRPAWWNTIPSNSITFAAALATHGNQMFLDYDASYKERDSLFGALLLARNKINLFKHGTLLPARVRIPWIPLSRV